MSSRTTTSVVTFLHPIVVAGYTDELPADVSGDLADGDAQLLRQTDGQRRLY